MNSTSQTSTRDLRTTKMTSMSTTMASTSTMTISTILTTEKLTNVTTAFTTAETLVTTVKNSCDFSQVDNMTIFETESPYRANMRHE